MTYYGVKSWQYVMNIGLQPCHQIYWQNSLPHLGNIYQIQKLIATRQRLFPNDQIWFATLQTVGCASMVDMRDGKYYVHVVLSIARHGIYDSTNIMRYASSSKECWAGTCMSSLLSLPYQPPRSRSPPVQIDSSMGAGGGGGGGFATATGTVAACAAARTSSIRVQHSVSHGTASHETHPTPRNPCGHKEEGTGGAHAEVDAPGCRPSWVWNF